MAASDLSRDTVGLVVAFQRGDREALRELLKPYESRPGYLKLLGAMSGLVVLSLEDLLRLAPDEIQGETVDEALRGLAARLALEEAGDGPA